MENYEIEHLYHNMLSARKLSFTLEVGCGDLRAPFDLIMQSYYYLFYLFILPLSIFLRKGHRMIINDLKITPCCGWAWAPLIFAANLGRTAVPRSYHCGIYSGLIRFDQQVIFCDCLEAVLLQSQ